MRSAVAVVVLLLSGLMVACGGASGPEDETSTGAPADVLAFATASGGKVLDANTFRFELQDHSKAVEYTQTCNPGADQIPGAFDLGRKLAFFDLPGGQSTDVVVSGDTYYIRSSALKGWAVGAEWLSVPLDDLQHLNKVAIATGLKIAPTFWQGQGGKNPATLLGAMSQSVTAVSDQGPASVRGVDTTRYELTIDPAKAGLWTGGSTTTTTSSKPRDLTSVRQRFLDMITRSDEGADIPQSARDAFLAGDAEPLIAFMEQKTSTTTDEGDRLVIEAMAAGDPDAFIAADEQSTGTTISAAGRAMMRALLDVDPNDPAAALGTLFNATTSYEASAYVDADGLLRRLDVRVGTISDGDSTTTTAESAFWIDMTMEFWDIGTPIDDGEPSPASVTAVADLPPAAIPAQLSPCYVTLGD